MDEHTVIQQLNELGIGTTVKPKTTFELLMLLEFDRRLSGMDVGPFAQHLGISQPMYSLWRDRKREPGRKTLAAIKAVYPDLVSDELLEQAR